MKVRTMIGSAAMLLAVTLCASAQPAGTGNRLERYGRLYDPAAALLKGENLHVSLEYANLLYGSGEPAAIARADSIVNAVVAFQGVDPESSNYGLWPWYVGGTVKDKNVPLFHTHDMLVDLWQQQDKMSFRTRSAFVLACRRLVEAAERRYDEEIWEIGRETVAYSNIFALYVQTLTVAADRFASQRLKRAAQIQWIRFYNHFLFYGIDEFLSTTYDDVIFNALLDIRDFAFDERMRSEAEEMLDYVYLAQSAVTHPLLKLPVTGIARDYRHFTRTGDVRVAFLRRSPEGYTPPAEAVAINTDRRYPFEATGRAGVLHHVYKTYQLPDAAMGSMSGWGNYYHQQVHCMASAGENENRRATLFVPGSYTPINGFTDQRQMSALCVYNRLTSIYQLTQWRGDMDNYRSTIDEFGIGVTENFTVVAEDDQKVVLRAYGYDFYLFPYRLDGRRIENAALTLKHRTRTSPRYHSRPAVFDEYVFPDEPLWFGVYIEVVPAGKKVSRPAIRYSERDGVHTFATNRGHSVSVGIMEHGNSVEVRPYDINLMPRFTIRD